MPNAFLWTRIMIENYVAYSNFNINWLDDVYIPKTVLLEVEWVLRHAYEIRRADITVGFQKLLGLPNVSVEDPDSIYQAISWYQNKFDFADALHLASSRRCESFATFDSSLIKKAQQFIIEGGEFNYKTLWSQTIFDTRHPKDDQATERKDNVPKAMALSFRGFVMLAEPFGKFFLNQMVFE